MLERHEFKVAFVSLCCLAALLWSVSACRPDLGDGDGDGDADGDSDGDGDGDADGDSDADPPFSCSSGTFGCWDGDYYECGSDGASRINVVDCEHQCDPRMGCVFCIPGSRRCEGDVSMVCSPSADAWFHGRDCSEWGTSCIEGTGYCADACAEAETSDSYVGCEYWPVALANTAELNSVDFDYRIVVANPNDAAATVRIHRSGAEVASRTIEGHGLAEIPLPWIEGQSFGITGDNWQSLSTPNGAYRLMSDLPVTVSQFNPFEYASATDFSYTNDATLLLPTHVLTRDYMGLTYVPFSRRTGIVGQPMTFTPSQFPDYIAVVGVAPQPTRVEVRAAGHVTAGGSVTSTSPGGVISFTINRGEVVHITAGDVPNCTEGRPGYSREEDCTMGMCNFMDTCREIDFDLTGSRISADHPIEVFGGHVCAYVPYTSQACDHLEVQLPPIETWGTEFVSMPMVDQGTNHQNLVRVVAAFDNTEVFLDPPPEGIGASTTLHSGQWVEFFVSGPFHVRGTEAIMVGQYMLGQNYPVPAAERGDPAMTVLVPSEQYRMDYTFSTPSSYRPDTNGQSYVMIVRPPGVELTLDGSPVSTSWQTIAGREVGVIPVGGGTHVITGADAFGLVAFGLGSYTSYAYPAGLNLEQITQLI